MFGFDPYDDMDMDGGPNRSGFAQKSAAAKGREEHAEAAFQRLKSTQEKLPDGITEKTTFDLLAPSKHLTQPCYTSFRKYVMKHPGWSVVRKEATAEEKRAHKETRQGKCYFIKATYDPKKAGKDTSGKKTASKAAADTTADGAGGAKQKAKLPLGAAAQAPAAKKQKQKHELGP